MRTSFITAFLVTSFFSTEVYAYLDPGSGTYIFQLLIAGLIGGGFAVKMTWKRLKGFIMEQFSKGSPQESDAKK
jgi:hypothetical protein